MSDELDWKVSVTVSDLPPTGMDYELVPDEAARASLARRAGVPSVVALRSLLKVSPEGRGVRVHGTLKATVNQICVVSLEPFENEVETEIDLRFEPESSATRAPLSEEVGGEDPPEPLIDGKLDLAEVVAEFLTLSIDPYPRRPGVVFSAPAESAVDEREPSPFAALAKLKPGENGKKQ